MQVQRRLCCVDFLPFPGARGLVLKTGKILRVSSENYGLYLHRHVQSSHLSALTLSQMKKKLAYNVNYSRSKLPVVEATMQYR